MSRDSCATYIHMHSSRHADLFEEFCRPPSSTPSTNQSNSNSSGAFNAGNNPAASSIPGSHLNPQTGMIQLPGHFLPFEEIALPPHLMPVNPEDEDGVVPDMHAAFGINRALGQNGTAIGGSGGEGQDGNGAGGAGAQREQVWRDLGLESLLDKIPTASGSGATTSIARREGKKTGILLLR